MREITRGGGQLRIGELTIQSPILNLFRSFFTIAVDIFHEHELWTPECFPILLPNLQHSKHIDRKTSGQLSLGFIPHYLFMQNERHGF